MKMTAEEIERLNKVKSEAEWNKVCDEIKARRGGSYPPDWFAIVVLSGLVNTIRMKNGW